MSKAQVLVLIVGFTIAYNSSKAVVWYVPIDAAAREHVANHGGCLIRTTYNAVAGLPLDTPTEESEVASDYWPAAVGIALAIIIVLGVLASQRSPL